MPLVQYGPALGVGTVGHNELIDFESPDELEEPEFLERINAVLPPGLRFKSLLRRPVGAQSLIKEVNRAEYAVKLDAPEIKAAVGRICAERVDFAEMDAGQRAAIRALHRALPLLRPGHSLRFVTLPAGDDPDSLIRHSGAPAFADILKATRPLAETLWQTELAAKSIETPERRADLERRVMEHADAIADRTVQAQYRRFLRERLFALVGLVVVFSLLAQGLTLGRLAQRLGI